jgi:hypothetical protein
MTEYCGLRGGGEPEFTSGQLEQPTVAAESDAAPLWWASFAWRKLADWWQRRNGLPVHLRASRYDGQPPPVGGVSSLACQP